MVPVEGHRLQALCARAEHLDDAVGLEILFGCEEGILTVEGVEITSVKEAKCGGRFLINNWEKKFNIRKWFLSEMIRENEIEEENTCENMLL